MRRGPKPQPPELAAAKASRPAGRRGKIVTLFDEHPDPKELPSPSWLSRDAKRIWKTKVDKYQRRGQKVFDFQGVLAQYCALEAKLRDLWKAGETPTMAMLNGYRIYAAEFHDTPASNKITIGTTSEKQNRFARRGQPPK
jgi:hypothetical protein